MIRYLANDPALEVPSPTFTLAQSYDLPFPIVPHDLYRINDSSELEEIGLSPLPEGTLALIEWPERAPDALPEDRIDIAFSHRPALGSTARAAEITGYGKAAAQVARLRAASFSPMPASSMPARAHAGRRLDPLLCAADPRRRHVDPDEFAAASGWPAIYDGKSYRLLFISPRTSSRSSPSTMACVRTASAPRHRHADLDSGFLITEDFGSAGVIEGDRRGRSSSATRRRPTCWRSCIAKPCPKRRRWSRRTRTNSVLRYRCMAGRDRPDARMVSAGSRR